MHIITLCNKFFLLKYLYCTSCTMMGMPHYVKENSQHVDYLIVLMDIHFVKSDSQSQPLPERLGRGDLCERL